MTKHRHPSANLFSNSSWPTPLTTHSVFAGTPHRPHPAATSRANLSLIRRLSGRPVFPRSVFFTEAFTLNPSCSLLSRSDEVPDLPHPRPHRPPFLVREHFNSDSKTCYRVGDQVPVGAPTVSAGRETWRREHDPATCPRALYWLGYLSLATYPDKTGTHAHTHGHTPRRALGSDTIHPAPCNTSGRRREAPTLHPPSLSGPEIWTHRTN